MQFLYVMDPMCAWCYGFQPELDAFLQAHPSANVSWVMGGLAPDSTTPMNSELRQSIAGYWHQIASVARVRFNHDYWSLNTPYRSTYAACRAVIAAEALEEGSAARMVKAIQAAYYQQAKNPSLEETLFDCACSINLETAAFIEAFQSTQTESRLQQHLSIAGQLQVTGFPALFVVNEGRYAAPLALGYCQVDALEQRLVQLQQM